MSGMGARDDGQLGNSPIMPTMLSANDIQSVAVRSHFAVFLKTDGSLWTMGDNFYGQLGDGTTTDRSAPVQVATGAASVSVGYDHTLFVKTDGSLWAMGNNYSGQLGDGSTANRCVPAQIATGVASVSAGGYHTLFVKTDGSLWAMGGNYYGQLGYGTITNRGISPVQVATGVAAAAAGGSHSLFLSGERPAAPIVTAQPTAQTVTTKDVAQFSITATSSVPLTYQWQVSTDGGTTWADLSDVTLYSGTTTSTLSVSKPTAAMKGYQYRCMVSDGVNAAIASSTAALTVKSSQFAALSARAPAGTGEQTLILGFVFAGGGKPTLVRGVGPGISSVSGYMMDPQLRVYTAGGVEVASNDDWPGSREFTDAFVQTGAGALDPASKDAALLQNLTGNVYTAHVSGANGTTGVALAEAYDVALSDKTKRLTALSVRNQVGVDDAILIAGFVINGDAPKRVIVRGVGPGISTVSGYMMDPQLRVYTAGGVEVASNDDWPGSRELTDAFVQTGAGPLDPASKDAALLQNLTGNVYTAHVSGANGTTGVALAEAYDVALSDKTKRLTALSVRNQVGVDDAILIAGFVIHGDAPKRVIVRGVGPGISAVNGYLRDPQLQVWKLNTVTGKWTLSGENDDWDHTPETAALFQSAGMGALGSDSKDAALVLTLEPGIYTAQVAGVGRTTGVGVVEIYEAP